MKKIFVLCALISFFYSCNNPKTGNGTPDLSGNTTTTLSGVAVTDSPLAFVKKIAIPKTELSFNQKMAFSDKKANQPIALFTHSDSYKKIFLNTAENIPCNQPGFDLLVYKTTGNTFKINYPQGTTTLSEAEYSQAFYFLMKNQNTAKELSPFFFLVKKNDGAIVNLSGCWDSVVKNGWLLVGNTSVSCGEGFSVLLKMK